MRIFIDQDKCCGSGQCVTAAPGIFDQRDDDGIVILLNAAPADDRLEDVEQAIRVCPALAIKLEK